MFYLAISIFGNNADVSAPLIATLLIIFMVLLVAAIAAVTVILVKRLRAPKIVEAAAEEAEEEDNEEYVEEENLELDEASGIAAPVAEEVLPADEELYSAGSLRYNRSFKAKYIQSDDELKGRYVHIKGELKSYKGVHDRLSWKRETFRIGKKAVARFSIRGKTLCLYLAINPASLDGTKYKVEDVSSLAYYADTPCMIRIRSNRRVKYACELIARLFKEQKVEKLQKAPNEDYYLPYESLITLIEMGLIKRIVRRDDEKIFKND